MSESLKPLLRSILGYAQNYRSVQDDDDSLKIPLDELVRFLEVVYELENPDQDFVTMAQIGSILSILSVSGLDRDDRVISTFSDQIRSNWSLPLKLNRTSHDPICDIVGTGGDGHNTFNVSTASAIVSAGAGLKVCKHGNRASSSSTGSADLIMALGIPLVSLSANDISNLLSSPTSPRFSFIYSPSFYPIFAKLGPLRRALGFRTIFNLIGPLLNPARPDRILLGVPQAELGPILSRSLSSLGFRSSWVVCGDEGLDEISPSGPTQVWKIDDEGKIEESTIEPEKDFGIPRHELRDVIGGEADENLVMMNNLLDQPIDQPRSVAIRDFVLINSAALLFVGGKAKSLRDGVELARESLRSGAARMCLNEFKVGVEEVLRK